MLTVSAGFPQFGRQWSSHLFMPSVKSDLCLGFTGLTSPTQSQCPEGTRNSSKSSFEEFLLFTLLPYWGA